MKRSVPALALASAALAGCQADLAAPRVPSAPTAAVVAAAAPSLAARGAEVIPGQYLVLFRGDRVARGADVATLAAAKLDQIGGASLARGAGRRGLRRTFQHAVAGFAAQLTDSAVAALRRDPDVALVEPDPVITATATQGSAPWGLDRLDQARLPLDRGYTYAVSGAGVTVYIVDSGIRLDHAEFGGRAAAGYDAVTQGGAAGDCHGHGTHVAGSVGGATYGVAKAARLVAVRVLGCDGNGSGSGLIAALDWVVQQKRANPSAPMVVNMSLGGGASSAIDQAVRNVVAAGVPAAVAAGNAGADACTQSPARAAEAITVGATNAGDAFASFSNYGACVDLLAPGVAITSAAIGSATATATWSGTSMATPHVAGAAALYLGANPSAAPAQVSAALSGGAVSGAVTGAPPGTPDRLLNVGFLNGTTTPAPAPLVNVTLVGQGSGRCLDADGSRGGANGSVAQLWTCFGNANQRWTLSPVGTAGEVRIWGGMCLDADRGTWQDGDIVHVWACNGLVHQRWTLTADGELRGLNNKCVTATGGATGDGTRMVLATCAARSEQRWAVR